MFSIRFASLLPVLAPVALAIALPTAAAAQTGALGAVRQPVVGQGGYTTPPAPISAPRDPRDIIYPGRYRLPRPQLNACRRSRPAFGDADFSFQGFDDAHIPC